MMKQQLARTAAALLLAGAAAGAQAMVMSASAHPEVDVTLSGWAFGSGHKVLSSATTTDGAVNYRGRAGAFTGTLAGAGDMDSVAFITWCIELEERVSFDSTLAYSLVGGSEYFGQRRGDAGIADRLGRLMTYAAEHGNLVGSASGSTALQLAVWNIVYDSDWTVGSAGGFRDSSSHSAAANVLLAGAQGLADSRYDVFALERAGSQDLLALSSRGQAAAAARVAVAEPGSLGLAGAALASLLLARRGRRPQA